MEEVSVLDGKPSRILNFPLTISQQVWLMFLIPSFFESAVYILDLATDVAIVAELLKEGYLIIGLISLIFLYIPPLILMFIHILKPSNLPPPDTSKFSERCANILGCISIEFFSFILFPLRPIYCFGERIFWAIEAARLEDPMKEEALINFEITRGFAIESYLFFQAFLHAGPQVILQVVLLVIGISSNDYTKIMQGVSVITSIATLALVTANYQRYETQCQGRRRRVLGLPQTQLQKVEASTEEPDSSDPLRVSEEREVKIPMRKRWTKAMDEDNPLGKAASFTFWLLWVLGRILSLVIAGSFIPWAVLGVLVAHYLFSLLYILPSPDCKTSIPIKLLLALLYLFVLLEVGVQFRKAYLLYSLFIVFTLVEDFVLTIVWVLWAQWSGWWYHYSLFLMTISHVFALLVFLLYVKYFSPKTIRIRPTSQAIDK